MNGLKNRCPFERSRNWEDKQHSPWYLYRSRAKLNRPRKEKQGKEEKWTVHNNWGIKQTGWKPKDKSQVALPSVYEGGNE